MIEKLRERNKFIGRVLGDVVDIELNELELGEPDFFFRTHDLWSNFTANFMDDIGFQKKSLDEMWVHVLELLWKFEYDKYCEDETETPEECEMSQMIDLVVKSIHHISEEGLEIISEPKDDDFMEEFLAKKKEV